MHFDNRPIVGYANFCPYSINDDVTDDFIVAVAKHEILHALVSLYFIYFDETELFKKVNSLFCDIIRGFQMDNMLSGEMKMDGLELQGTVTECPLSMDASLYRIKINQILYYYYLIFPNYFVNIAQSS